MSSNLMVEDDSALSQDVKMATLSEEITRRLRNTSLEIEPSISTEIVERACTKMKTSGLEEVFIMQAVIQGIKSFEGKVMRSKLDPDHPGFQPLYQKAGWRRNEMAREKALKRGNWFKGRKEKEEWRNLTKTSSSRRMNRNRFQKAGDRKGQAAIVVFVPSNKGGLLVRKLRERKEEMAALTGFNINYH